MTFWWSEDNYGQLLQCYALQKYLQDMGHDAYLIRYDPREDYVKSSIWEKAIKALDPVKLQKFLLFKKRKIVDMLEKHDSLRDFLGFRNRHIRQSEKIYYSYKELVEDPPDADMYIVGSDQVWNTFPVPTKRVINRMNAYLLNFGNSLIKKISYAASFGKQKDELDSDFINLFSSLLKNFEYVSVREKSGLEICRQCGIDDAELVPDPTMLLSADAYRNLYIDNKIKYFKKYYKPYCLLYLLGNETDFPIRDIYDWFSDKNIEIVYVPGNFQYDNYKKNYVTIPEWIYLLEHAECIITNSYHCAVFSIIFKKTFGVIPLVKNYENMNTRFDTLFQLLEIKKTFIDRNNIGEILQKDQMDWDKISGMLEQIRLSCKLNSIIQKN